MDKAGWYTVYVGIGSNLGNRQENIIKAIDYLESNPQIKIEKVSSLYETDPVGGPPQGKFLNGVLKIITTLSPKRLLSEFKRIEKLLGRVKSVFMKKKP